MDSGNSVVKKIVIQLISMDQISYKNAAIHKLLPLHSLHYIGVIWQSLYIVKYADTVYIVPKYAQLLMASHHSISDETSVGRWAAGIPQFVCVCMILLERSIITPAADHYRLTQATVIKYQ